MTSATTLLAMWLCGTLSSEEVPPAATPAPEPSAVASPLPAPAPAPAPAANVKQAEEAAQQNAQWSIGTGVSLNPGAAFGAGSSLLSVEPPTVTMSVERRLGRKVWLVFGAGGGLSSGLNASSTTVFLRRYSAAFLAGGRFTVIGGPSIPVVGSVVATARAGYSSSPSPTPTGATSQPSLDAWRAGGGVGLAADGHLNPYVALRITTTVAEVAYTSQPVQTSSPFGAPTTSQVEGLDVGFAFDPSIELRVFF